MDLVTAVFLGIGYLTVAYLLGYPIEVACRPVFKWAANFMQASAGWTESNAEYDRRYGRPRWRRTK